MSSLDNGPPAEALFDVPLASLTKPVASELIDEALAAARFTPSTANLQPWTFIRVTRPVTLRTTTAK